MKISTYIFPYALLVVFILSLVTNWYEPLIYAANIICILLMLDKLGKGIVLREVIALFNCFICLFMPLMGYLFFTRNDPLAASFLRFMPVARETYFNFALPAVTGFVTTLCWPLKSEKNADYGVYLNNILNAAKKQLEGNQKFGVILLGIGVVISTLIVFVPVSLQYVFTLIYFSSFSGLLYIYFTKRFPFKATVMILFGLFIVAGSLGNGMFTILTYMGMTIFSFFFIGQKTALWKKMTVFAVAIFILTILQTVKPEYRVSVLRKNSENKGSEFLKIALKRIDNLENAFTTKYLFPVYYRTNQGFYVALVMKRFPELVPYDNGEYLFKVLISALVPRFLWPDKPMAGGIANMKYFTGYTIKGYTTNVGPLGEAYGSFGPVRGILYMIFLGAFIRFAYARIFVIAKRLPLIIFWIPVIFYQVTYSAENDTLQIMNSLIKSAFFVYVIYKMFPQIFPSRRFSLQKRTNSQLTVNPV